MPFLDTVPEVPVKSCDGDQPVEVIVTRRLVRVVKAGDLAAVAVQVHDLCPPVGVVVPLDVGGLRHDSRKETGALIAAEEILPHLPRHHHLQGEMQSAAEFGSHLHIRRTVQAVTVVEQVIVRAVGEVPGGGQQEPGIVAGGQRLQHLEPGVNSLEQPVQQGRRIVEHVLVGPGPAVVIRRPARRPPRHVQVVVGEDLLHSPVVPAVAVPGIFAGAEFGVFQQVARFIVQFRRLAQGLQQQPRRRRNNQPVLFSVPVDVPHGAGIGDGGGYGAIRDEQHEPAAAILGQRHDLFSTACVLCQPLHDPFIVPFGMPVVHRVPQKQDVYPARLCAHHRQRRAGVNGVAVPLHLPGESGGRGSGCRIDQVLAFQVQVGLNHHLSFLWRGGC